MRMIALALLIGCAACTHVEINARSNATPAAGTAVNSTGASVQLSGGNTLAAVILAGMLASGALEDLREPRSYATLSSFSEWIWGRPLTPLAPDRAISEQDCTRPIELSGNLKCR